MTNSASGPVAHNMVTTTFELNGYQIVTNLGLVRGIVVRSRSVVGTIGASLQTLLGGDISLFTQPVRTRGMTRSSACSSTHRRSELMPSSAFAMTLPKSCKALLKSWLTEPPSL